VLDTAVHPSDDFALFLKWEEPSDIRMAAREGIVALPTRSAIELMVQHLDLQRWFEVPVRSLDLPLDYRTGRRATWLLTV
jgi:hypothetical protein